MIAAAGLVAADGRCIAPLYGCTLCGASWSYRAVRHVARCPDCGGGLRRAEELSEQPGATAGPDLHRIVG